MKQRSFAVRIRQTSVTEIERLTDEARKAGQNIGMYGSWLVEADEICLKCIEENFNIREVVDQSIKNANLTLQSNDDWYAEFDYVHTVKREILIHSLDRVINAALSVYDSNDLLVYGNGVAVVKFCEDKGVPVRNDQKRSLIVSFKERASLFAYLGSRIAIGVARLIPILIKQSARGGAEYVLVGSSDIYRLVGSRYENPVTGEIRRELVQLNHNVIYMSSPHGGGDRKSKVRALWGDDGAITSEAVIALSCLAHPWRLSSILLRKLIYGSAIELRRELFSFCISAFERFIVRARVKRLMISGEYSRIPRIAITACNRCNIPSAGVQHGVIHSRHPGYTMVGYADRLTTPKSLLVHGAAYVDIINSIQGSAAPSLFVIGNPAVSSNKVENISIRSERGAGSRKLKILFASQPQIRILLHRACQSERSTWLSDNADAIIKLHPAYENTVGVYKSEAFISFFSDVQILPLDSDVYNVLSGVDIVVSRNSTILQEALLCNIPVVEVLDDMSEYSFSGEFKTYCCPKAICSTSAEQLFSTLENYGKRLLDEACKNESGGGEKLVYDDAINTSYDTVTVWLKFVEQST